MKKVFLCLLAVVVMLSGTSIVINAQEISSGVSSEAVENNDNQPSGNASVKNTDAKEKVEKEIDSGKLEVRVFSRESDKNMDTITAVLQTADGATITGVASKEQDNMFLFEFKSVPNGVYKLAVTGNNYEVYTSTVTVNSNVSKIRLINTHRYNQSYLETKENIGSFGYGDFNGDGVIDDKDKNALIYALETGSNDTKFDINDDGTVNLADLSAFALSYADEGSSQQIQKLTAQVETFALPSIKDEDVNGTVDSGSLTDILTDNGQSVSLATADGNDISESNPIELTISLSDENNSAKSYVVDQVLIKAPESKENAITGGTILVETEDGQMIEATIVSANSRAAFNRSAAATATVNEDGSIVLNLGNQVAIKKVTIKVTATSSNKLADIAQVEFLNGMEDRIPAPKLDIPNGLAIENGDEQLTATWKAAQNITGYQVKVINKGQEQVFYTDKTTFLISKFNNKDLVNGETYDIAVQSVNGNVNGEDYWQSGYSATVQGKPEPASIPDAPDNVTATGGYRSVKVSWKKMKSTDTYTVYYREKGQGEFQEAKSNIVATSYTIEGLKDGTTYEVYVTGTNKIGTGKPSITNEAKTSIIQPAQLPNYKLINTSNGEGVLSNHIISTKIGRGSMVDSPLDAAGSKTANGVVDNNYGSYLNVVDWDEGGHYPADNKGVTVEFDDYYEMNYITLAEPQDFGSYGAVNIQYTNTEGQKLSVGASISQKTSPNGRKYYVIKTAKPITTNKIKIGIGRPYANINKVTIAEMNFYYYDSIEDDINAMFSDSLHVALNEGVTLDTVGTLQERLDTPDSVSGEYHPDRVLLQKELDMAKSILEQQSLGTVLNVDTTISSRNDSHLGFSGLNAWQPLGVVGFEGEEIVIYVGQAGKRNGDAVNLQLVTTQYHAESSALSSSPINLKVGRNVITVPKIQSLAAESGGALYVQYTGNNANEKIGVRVSGGSKVPTLNLHHVTNASERRTLVNAYVKELEAYVPTIETLHNELHKGHEATNYNFDEKNCILGATDIMLDQMMYSVSSKQILAGLQGTTDEKTDALLNSLDAMDDMMQLFYQHKGLSNASDAGAKNKLPTQHLNIRYQRMFAGAFMYAGGNHIGIEWGSVPGLSNSTPIQTNNGKYVSGNYFGWGIAHEIGHNINQGSYAIAEITNNYFSILAQAKDSNDSVRFSYDKVYDKVTSGIKGRDNNVFTQLAMYWQLHLAYDKNYNYTTFDAYNDQFNNLFYARVDSYSRDPSKAPQAAENGVALTLTGNVDQKFMRLASAAAEKDLSDFFDAWGMIPDATTKAYMSQFEPESRKIQYIDDDSRTYQIENGNKMSEGTTVSATLDHQENSNQVTLHISNSNSNDNAMLGYEILRNGETIGFINANETTYVDTIATVNNRVFEYSVVGYDRYLNKTETCTLDPLKISHDGSLDKSKWILETNMTSADDVEQTPSEDNPDGLQPESAITRIIDNDVNTTYTGSVAKGNAEVIVSMNELNAITGIKYTAPSKNEAIKNYDVYVSSDKANWQLVKSGTFELDENNTAKVYFNKENDHSLYTYDASYVKLVIKGTSASISELDILGPAGDNVDLLPDNGIGILKEDYVLDATTGSKIPKGSLIFTGSYKGDPAYNVVLLKDENGNIINGSQIIFADVPEHGELAEVSEGTWVYYIEPSDLNGEFVLPQKVMAELYRVNDAITLEGQRLTSNALYVNVPEVLPEISLQGKQ